MRSIPVFWQVQRLKQAEQALRAKAMLVERRGDETGRMNVFDIARGLDWPWHFSGRVFRNAFSDQWEGDIDGPKRNAAGTQRLFAASAAYDFSIRPVIAGEAADLSGSVKPAREIIEDTIRQAALLLRQGQDLTR